MNNTRDFTPEFERYLVQSRDSVLKFLKEVDEASEKHSGLFGLVSFMGAAQTLGGKLDSELTMDPVMKAWLYQKDPGIEALLEELGAFLRNKTLYKTTHRDFKMRDLEKEIREKTEELRKRVLG